MEPLEIAFLLRDIRDGLQAPQHGALIVQAVISVFAGLIGAGFGAYFGYRLASHREDELIRERKGIEMMDRVLRLGTDLIPTFQSLRRAINSPDPPAYLYPKYLEDLLAAHSKNDEIAAIHLEIKYYLPRYATAANRMFWA